MTVSLDVDELNPLVERVHDRLNKLGLHLAVAESCTGGLIGASVTAVSGSSDIFEGGVISYSNRLKSDLLDVPEDVLNREGAVSKAVAEAMARGCRQRLETDLSLAVTGIAGPGGGTDSRPVGLVHFGVAYGDDVWTRHEVFDGDRSSVRIQTVRYGLEWLLDVTDPV